MLLTNKYNLPSTLFDALNNDTYDVAANSNILSVTRIIDSPKIAQLTKRHWNQLEDDISNRIWLLLGSATHTILERVNEEGRLLEKRMYIDTTTWEIVDKEHLNKKTIYIAGKPDVYEKKEKAIRDYKITSAWSVIYGKKEWAKQLNCYAYFYRKLGYEVKELTIIAILKDWNKKDALRSTDYPKIPVAVINIPLWTFEEQQKYIEERVRIHSQYNNLKDDEIPECTEAERWHKPGAFAVYKNDNKTAFRVFPTSQEAEIFKSSIEKTDTKNSYSVVERQGTDNRCQGYCNVTEYCHFFKKTYGSSVK